MARKEQQEGLTRRARGAVAAKAVGGLLAAAIVAVSPVGETASAHDGDAQPMLIDTTTPQATASPGAVIQYAINYTCSNNDATAPIDGCDGAVFRDPIPTFTDIFGARVPVEFVSATGPASVWPSGFALDTSDPANPAVAGTAGTWDPGTSGVIFVIVRVPVGTVPAGPQPVVNTARVTDPTAPADDSTTATTTIAATTPAWTISKVGPTTGTRMNRDQTWTISVCGPSTSALWPLYTVTDTLPAGARFVSATRGGQYADDAPTPLVSDGAGVVTWTFDAGNRPPLTNDGCFRMNITAQFPIGYVDPDSTDHANDDNAGGAKKVDIASGSGRNVPAEAGTGLGSASWTTTLAAPGFGLGGGGTAKTFTDAAGASNFYVASGDTGRFNLSGSIDSDVPVDSFTIADGSWSFNDGTATTKGTGMPTSFVPTQIVPGTWNAPLTATIEGSDDNFNTPATVIAPAVASGATAIVLETPYRSIRWRWGGAPDSVPGDFSATGMRIVGTVGTDDSSNAFGLYTNTSTMTVTHHSDPPVVRTASDQYMLEPALPHPSISKTVKSATRQPGQTDTYTIKVSNSADATGALAHPYVEDCVPASFQVQGAATLGSGWSPGSPLPPCSSGQTPLRFDYAGTLAPGQSSTSIVYTILVAGSNPGPAAPFGTYQNTAVVRPAGGGAFAHCGNTNPPCASRVSVTVSPIVELTSRKCVTGDLDRGELRPSPGCLPGGASVTAAQTVPGGAMSWTLEMRNTGNTDATNIAFIDIFPDVGDTAVVTTSNGTLNQRFTEFAPYLVSAIAPADGWLVAYSTSPRPCRPEVGGPHQPGVDCDDPHWVTDPALTDLPSFRSVKFTYGHTLATGQAATFTWAMRAPVNDPTYDRDGTSPDDPYEALRTCAAQAPRTDPAHCPRAVNSFAYGADATNLPVGVPTPSRLFAEPPQVEVRVVAEPRPNAIGDRVWFDRNFDGIQGPDRSAEGEPGIPDVYIELYTAGNPTPIFDTFTDRNGDWFLSGGADGLPDGDYVVRAYLPAGCTVSPADRSGTTGDAGAAANTDDDSDFPQAATGSNAIGTYHDSPLVHLGDDTTTNAGQPDEGEIDRSWDLGLWHPLPLIDTAEIPDTAGGNSDHPGTTAAPAGIAGAASTTTSTTATTTTTSTTVPEPESAIVIGERDPGDRREAPDQVGAHRTAPTGTLPVTGGELAVILLVAAISVAAGIVLTSPRRRSHLPR